MPDQDIGQCEGLNLKIWGFIPLEMEEHPGISQGIRLDALQVEELGDTFIIGAE